MTLIHVGNIELPAHLKEGGFDHAALHQGTERLYVAHTANDAVDVIDCRAARYLHSIPGLVGVAGVLVSEEGNLAFTSNRGENTVGIFAPPHDTDVVKVGVGVRPNGLSFDSKRNILLAANVGDATVPDSHTLSMIDVDKRTLVAVIPVPGRTRWTVFDANTDTFYVNIADPALIVTIEAGSPNRIARTFVVPSAGPHGLDMDAATNRLFCACDGKLLICLDAHSGRALNRAELGGKPDVIFLNAQLRHLYVAIGDPGIIEVFGIDNMQRISVTETESGAHTIAFDPSTNKIYAFLPQSHQAVVYVDQ
ncbi:MAG: YncE family protein [Aggregatilineales bacterium]